MLQSFLNYKGNLRARNFGMRAVGCNAMTYPSINTTMVLKLTIKRTSSNEHLLFTYLTLVLLCSSPFSAPWPVSLEGSVLEVSDMTCFDNDDLK